MRAGKLRHRISIEKPVVSQTTTGAVDRSWLEFAALWAEIDPKQGREALKSGQMFEVLDIIFGVRYQPGIRPEMRVKYGSRYFDIKSVVNEYEMDRKIYIGAQEIGGVGISEKSFSNEFTAEFA